MVLFLFLILIFPVLIFSDDLKIGEEFKEGDIVSAETFNQIFDTIEKINRTITTDDLIGTWSCDAMTTRETDGWTNKGLYYAVEDAQVNFFLGVDGTGPYQAITTSAPSPFKRQSTSFSGRFEVLNNKLFTKNDFPGAYGSDSNAKIYDINFISDTRFELTFLETSAETFPTNYSSFITCDAAVKVPAAPTKLIAENEKGIINLSWNDASIDEEGFKIYRKVDGSTEYNLLGTLTETSFVDSDTSEGIKYFYYVISYNENGDSLKSLIVSATSDSIPPTIISTSPANNETVAKETHTIRVEFSERVKIVCPQSACDLGTGAIYLTANIEGSSRNPSLRVPYSDPTYNLYFIVMGTAEAFDSNQSNIQVFVNKNWIKDANGIPLESDYTFSFNVE